MEIRAEPAWSRDWRSENPPLDAAENAVRIVSVVQVAHGPAPALQVFPGQRSHLQYQV